MSTTAAEKAALRRAIRAAQRSWTAQRRRESDRALFARFLTLPELAGAETVLLFHGMGAEPDTRGLIAALLAEGKRVALPRCRPGHTLEARRIEMDSTLMRHPYGMDEPGEDCPLLLPGEVDLVLVPALCYDRAGFRLGQGGGYYDRYLAAFSGTAAGLCRAEFLREQLPREEHDRPVDLVLTEEETLRPVPSGGR